MSNTLNLVIYQKMSTEDISNMICRLVSRNDPSPEGLIWAAELMDLLEIRRSADNFDTKSYDRFVALEDDRRADEEANYPVFARFATHDYMDMYPSYDVRVMPRKDIYPFVKHMNKAYSGGTTTFDKVLSKKEVEDYIDRMIRYYPEEVFYIEYLQDNYYKIFQV